MEQKKPSATVASGETTTSQSSSPSSPIAGQKQTRYYWKAPVLMVVPLIVGLLLAVGQHLFYKSLDGDIVGSKSQQSWNNRYGVAMTFLIRAFLGTAIGTAGVQNIWYLLGSKATKLETMDAVAAIMSSFTDFLNPRVWIHGPVLSLLAVGVWIVLPLAAISPPTTLTVQGKLRNSSISTKIPNLDYAINNFALGGSNAVGEYSGPAAAIERIVNSVFTQGSIVNLTSSAPCQYCSFPLQFYGPIMTCTKVSNETQTMISRAIYAAGSSNPSSYTRPPHFVAFTPIASKNGVNVTENALNASITNSIKLTFGGDSSIFRSFDTASSIAKTFLFMYDEDKSLECGLYNASYEVEFEFNNGAQSISVRKPTPLNGISFRESSTYFQLNAYRSSVPSQNATAAASNLYWTRRALHQLAFQAIGQAINKRLVGLIQDTMYSGVIASNTEVLSSSLGSTPELGPFSTLQKASSDDPEAPAVDYSHNVPLAQAVQDLSINVTLSLFSSPEFLQGARSMTSSMAPAALTNATNTTVLNFSQDNIYVYTPRDLFISWGIAILYTLFAVLLGMLAIAQNGATYSNSFSTVVRSTRQMHQDSEILAAETSGADPLPAALATEVFTLKLKGRDQGYQKVPQR
ncbi:hypothetical protein VTL71DRAFT_8841 [Oculimacula yallundae]|uniref:Uncharacterized protein n=1 Tax=Oculimacula yallundae TaxID=86028 RepID=A0ABR4BT27_9HELO